MSEIIQNNSDYSCANNNLIIENYQGSLWISLNRPAQRNALDCQLLEDLLSALKQSRLDPEVKCIVITGEGKGFCAGADVAEWVEMEATGQLETYGWTERAHAVMLELSTMPKPTVAAINGTAVGGGLDLALSCDFRYSVPTAKFLAGYTRMGFSPDAGSSYHLPRLIGMEATKEFLFFDQPWSAEKALNKGMITDVLDADGFYDHVAEKTDLLAFGPIVAIGETKKLLEKSYLNSFEEQLAMECESALVCGRSEDAKEAIIAANEQRAPNFKGQ